MLQTKSSPRRQPLHPATLMLMGQKIAAHRVAGAMSQQGRAASAANRDGLPIRAGENVGLAAGMSQDGVTSVHDRAMPRWYADGQGRRFDLQESRDYHERVEKALLDAGHSYNEAHRAATEAEHARMRQLGFDPNAVEDFQKPYIDQAAHRARVLGNTTRDVTGEPYQDSGENAMREDGGEPDPRYILDRDGNRYTRPVHGKLLDSIEMVIGRSGDGRYAAMDPNSGMVLAEGGDFEAARQQAEQLAARAGRRRLQAALDQEPARSQQQLRERFGARGGSGSKGAGESEGPGDGV